MGKGRGEFEVRLWGGRSSKEGYVFLGYKVRAKINLDSVIIYSNYLKNLLNL